MISPERIENAMDRGRTVLRISRYAVPGGALLVLVATTITETPAVTLPLSVVLLALVAAFGLGYLAARSADEERQAVAELSRGRDAGERE